MPIEIQKYEDEPISATCYLSKTDDNELLKDLNDISLIHGRFFGGYVLDTPVFRMKTQQNPFYVHRTKMPKTESPEIDVKTLRKIIENFTKALIILHTGKNDETQVYFLPAAVKAKDETKDPYTRMDCFLPDLNINVPEWFDKKRDLELSDIISSSA